MKNSQGKIGQRKCNLRKSQIGLMKLMFYNMKRSRKITTSIIGRHISLY